MGIPNSHIPANMRPNARLVPAALSNLSALKKLDSAGLTDLGQLTHPYMRRADERGFSKVSWPTALRAAGQALAPLPGTALAFLAGPQAGSDEDYYTFAKWAYASGCPNIDTWYQESWQASAAAMLRTIGTTDSTVIPEELLAADTIFLWETSPGEWSDELIDLLVGARARGAWVVLFHPVIAHPVERKWNRKRLQHHPRVARLIDTQISLRPGGKPAFVNALLTEWVHRKREATSFITRHTSGWETLCSNLRTQQPRLLLDQAGVTQRTFDLVFNRLLTARNWISVLGDGFCTLPNGTEATQALLNLHLAAGAIGRKGTGVLNLAGTPTSACTARFGLDPQRGPGNCVNTETERQRWSERWAFPVSLSPGMTALQSFQSAADGTLQGLICFGGMHVPNHTDYSAASGPKIRIHIASTLDKSMLLPSETTVLLPAMPPGGAKGTSVFSTAFRLLQIHKQTESAIPGLRPSWRVMGEVAALAQPRLSGHLHFASSKELHNELAQFFSPYNGLDQHPAPEWLQWPSRVVGGHFEDRPDQKAAFHPVQLNTLPRGHSLVAVHDLGDAAQEDRIVLLSERDGQRFGLSDGEYITLSTSFGKLTAPVRFGAIRQGCVWAHHADRLDDPNAISRPGWRTATLHSKELEHEAC